jgi:hypothetical protein
VLCASVVNSGMDVLLDMVSVFEAEGRDFGLSEREQGMAR